jgi:2-oxoacid:acceptor oxidoreductase gamma subunit (pyruvate/2-ketoisovalerate family)
MIEIRIHGRGGQGAVIASKMLAVAIFKEGRFAQSFPAFGVERRGAPVTAFTRIDDKQIRLRCEIHEPDHIMVLDPSLVGAINIIEGLKENGWILINSDKKPDEYMEFKKFRVATVNANAIALKHQLGSKTQPIVNTAILGAFSNITGLVTLDSILQAVDEEVPMFKENNLQAVKEAYKQVIF